MTYYKEDREQDRLCCEKGILYPWSHLFIKPVLALVTSEFLKICSKTKCVQKKIIDVTEVLITREKCLQKSLLWLFLLLFLCSGTGV
jgi:hypothetical protein